MKKFTADDARALMKKLQAEAVTPERPDIFSLIESAVKAGWTNFEVDYFVSNETEQELMENGFAISKIVNGNNQQYTLINW